MLAGDTHPGGTTTAALEECSRVKISRLPVQLRDNRKPQEGQSGRAATKSRLASGEGVPLLVRRGGCGINKKTRSHRRRRRRGGRSQVPFQESVLKDDV